jgi:hypothetical protein
VGAQGWWLLVVVAHLSGQLEVMLLLIALSTGTPSFFLRTLRKTLACMWSKLLVEDAKH